MVECTGRSWSNDGQVAVALDIGGTHTSAAVVQLTSRCLYPESLVRRPTTEEGTADELLDAWADIARQAWQHVGQTALVRLGVAMPGPFDYAGGIGYAEHKFASLFGIDVRKGLCHRLFNGSEEIPILFGNDAAMFALGEWWAGRAQGAGRVMGVTLGTGLGSGFVESGRPLYEGEGVPFEGQIWNMVYAESIAEDYVSGRSITAAYLKRTGIMCDALSVAKAAENGDENAKAVYRELGHHLGKIILPWITSFHPDVLVLGGNITRSWPLFSEEMKDVLAPMADLRVERTVGYDMSNLLGAAIANC
jgi:glucokinase